MNTIDKRNIFLNHLSKIYKQNPNLPIYSDTIYYELIRFKANDENKYQNVKETNLLGVQVKLNNHLKNNPSLEIFSNGYYLIIENRKGSDSKSFYHIINNSIKMYIPVNAEDLYPVSLKLINFLTSENIIMQCKIAKKMRNDALVLSIETKEAILKVEGYLKKLKLHSEVEPNPFLFQRKNIAFTIDKGVSYNKALSKLLSLYFTNKRKTNTLDEVDSSDFTLFVKRQVQILSGAGKKSIMNKYEIKSLEKFNSFIIISELILKTLEDSLTLEEIFSYQSTEELKENDEKDFAGDKEKILYVIDRLSNIYDLKKVHLIIMKYIETGNTNLFVREENIRKVVIENFSSQKLKRIISDMGWNALISATYETYNKYGYDQSIYAINELLEKDDISSFTNDNSTRSYLGLIIPIELLKSTIKEKINNLEIDLNAVNVTDIILKKVNIAVSTT